MFALRKNLCFLICAWCLCSATALAAEHDAPWTLAFELSGKPTLGWPVNWTENAVQVLSPDGRLTTAKLTDISKPQKISDEMRVWTQAEFRAALQRELGAQLEVSGTGHYLVAHPPGRGGVWAKRFEEIYRSFVQQFTVRGLICQEPRFPLVAIVFTDQRSFQKYAAKEGTSAAAGMLGYYSLNSNRVALFDVTAGNDDDANWQTNAATIIHEATHQMAFNTGVHSRFAPPPRWICEGLAMLYEAPGFHSPRLNSRPGDKINFVRLRDFRQYYPTSRTGLLATMIQSDRGFEENVLAGYASAWAVSYFLMERYPQGYCNVLARTSHLNPLTAYPAAERKADFDAAFPGDLRVLERDFYEFIATLPDR